MASNGTLPHLSNCACDTCQHLPSKQRDKSENPSQSIATMPHTGKDYFDDGAYETASESEAGRTKDEDIRQAPYLPRIQIWARDDGPYTLRIGHQWFHCDDLVINGAEYRQKPKKSSAPQPRQPTTPNQSAPRRPAGNRQQSYQRARPDKNTQPSTSTAAHASQSQYQPQQLPTPKEQTEKRKAERRRQKDAEVQKQAQHQESRPRRDSGVSVGSDAAAQSGQLVPYGQTQPQPQSQPQPRPGLERRASKQAQPMRPRPGRGLSRGSSYTRPVQNKSKKSVRFAASPGPQ